MDIIAALPASNNMALLTSLLGLIAFLAAKRYILIVTKMVGEVLVAKWLNHRL